LIPAIFVVWTARLIVISAGTLLPFRYLDFMHTFVNSVFLRFRCPGDQSARVRHAALHKPRNRELRRVQAQPIAHRRLAENTG
jgi:hypothetical protein